VREGIDDQEKMLCLKNDLQQLQGGLSQQQAWRQAIQDDEQRILSLQHITFPSKLLNQERFANEWGRSLSERRLSEISHVVAISASREISVFA
jgi:hypothetical protein